MKTTTVNVGGMPGTIFEGEVPGTFCFVPENCIHEEHGERKIAEADYVRSHWDERNMRASEVPEGKRLYPKSDHPIEDLLADPVRGFVDRIRHAWPERMLA